MEYVTYQDILSDSEVYWMLCEVYFQLRDPAEAWRFYGKRKGIPIKPKPDESLALWIRRQTPRSLAVHIGTDRLGWGFGFVITLWSIVDYSFRDAEGSNYQLDKFGCSLQAYLLMHKIVLSTLNYQGVDV